MKQKEIVEEALIQLMIALRELVPAVQSIAKTLYDLERRGAIVRLEHEGQHLGNREKAILKSLIETV